MKLKETLSLSEFNQFVFLIDNTKVVFLTKKSEAHFLDLPSPGSVDKSGDGFGTHLSDLLPCIYSRLCLSFWPAANKDWKAVNQDSLLKYG